MLSNPLGPNLPPSQPVFAQERMTLTSKSHQKTRNSIEHSQQNSSLIPKPAPTCRDPKKLEAYKSQLSLTTEQKDIGVGCLLGDASLKRSNTNGEQFRLQFQYSLKNASYAFDIYQKFEPWCLSPPHQRTRKAVDQTGQPIQYIGFQTLFHKEFSDLASLFKLETPKAKKGISKNLVLKHVSPQALAYWFMDDGGKLDYTSNNGKGIVLNTQCFLEPEVHDLATELGEKFDLKTWVGQNKGKPVLKISGESYETFYELINPYMVDEMRSKLPTPRNVKLFEFIRDKRVAKEQNIIPPQI